MSYTNSRLLQGLSVYLGGSIGRNRTRLDQNLVNDWTVWSRCENVDN